MDGAALPLSAARERLYHIAAGRIPKPQWALGPSRLQKTRRHRQADEAREWQYGLSAYDFDRLVRNAMGRCGLCGHVDDGSKLYGLVLDHDHHTKQIRGMLCGPCNRAIHYVERHGIDGKWLRRAQLYLKASPPLTRRQLR